MTENRTQPTNVTVEEFLETVQSERRRDEGKRLLEIMREVTGDNPVMWGPSIVGFGTMRYTYKTGREGDWPKVGFSPRKAQLTFYGLKDLPEQQLRLAELGPHTTGAGCVYAKKLEDLDEEVLRDLIGIGHQRGGHICPPPRPQEDLN